MQAVLITPIRDYGIGRRLAGFWDLVALAKRMGTLLGLRDSVQNYCTTSIRSPTFHLEYFHYRTQFSRMNASGLIGWRKYLMGFPLLVLLGISVFRNQKKQVGCPVAILSGLFQKHFSVFSRSKNLKYPRIFSIGYARHPRTMACPLLFARSFDIKSAVERVI